MNGFVDTVVAYPIILCAAFKRFYTIHRAILKYVVTHIKDVIGRNFLTSTRRVIKFSILLQMVYMLGENVKWK